METFKSKLTSLLAHAVKYCYGIEYVMEVSYAEKDGYDFQYNGCFSLSKKLGKAPTEIAEKLIETIRDSFFISSMTVGGKGFINIIANDMTVAQRMNFIKNDPRLGIPVAEPKSIVLDYGGPNIAKPLHVGHLRSAVIGDTLRKMFLFNGDKVVGDSHLGDWGLQMGLLIAYLEEKMPHAIYFDPNISTAFYESTFAASPVSLIELETMYPEAAQKAKDDPVFKAKAKIATNELQRGRPGYVALWKHFVDTSLASVKKDFKLLGVEFDIWGAESDTQSIIADMLAMLYEKSLVELSDGALIAKTDGDMPPLIVRSSDGSSLYGTTDLATILDRQEKYNPDYILYCVDQRQEEHFKQVFAVAAKTGMVSAKLEHLPNGTVNGSDGKPLKTRNGGVAKLSDLIDMSITAAQDVLVKSHIYDTLSPMEAEEVGHAIGIGALRYAELSNARTTSYAFDESKFSFDGKTGPYISYQAVRMKNILRKAGFNGGKIVIGTEIEKTVALLIDDLPNIFAAALNQRMPNLIANHVYKLAQAASRFYTEFNIMAEENLELKLSRLSLAKLIKDTITLEFELLGIRIPEHM